MILSPNDAAFVLGCIAHFEREVADALDIAHKRHADAAVLIIYRAWLEQAERVKRQLGTVAP